MRASRLLAILISLQVRGRVSARELADEFEVSRRTIYRDIDELSAAGVPVYAELGINGGFVLTEGWNEAPTGMTTAEIEAAIFAGLPGPAAELGVSLDAVTARLKLMAATSPGTRGTAVQMAERFHFDATPWHRRVAAPPPFLRVIAQAIWENQRVKIDYESWQKSSTRVLEPLGLVLKAGGWYFVCQRAGRPMIFKVENVRAAQLLGERFRRPARFDLPAAWSGAVAKFETGLVAGHARLRVRATAVSHLERLGAAMAEPIRAAPPGSDGSRTATVEIESVDHAAGLLLGFGIDIEVLEPLALQRELARRAGEMVALYGNDGQPEAAV